MCCTGSTLCTKLQIAFGRLAKGDETHNHIILVIILCNSNSQTISSIAAQSNDSDISAFSTPDIHTYRLTHGD